MGWIFGKWGVDWRKQTRGSRSNLETKGPGCRLVLCHYPHTMPYHTTTIPFHTILYYTISYHTVLYHTIPCHTTLPYHIIPYQSIPYHTVITTVQWPGQRTCHMPSSNAFHTLEPSSVWICRSQFQFPSALLWNIAVWFQLGARAGRASL